MTLQRGPRRSQCPAGELAYLHGMSLRTLPTVALVTVYVLVVVCPVSQAAPGPRPAESALSYLARGIIKRQYGDLDLTHYRAKYALLDRLRSGCSAPACGLVDVLNRIRRSSADQRVAELQALIAIARGRTGAIGHGVVDPYGLSRRASADQRIAELQALIGMSQGGTGLVGHGKIDPLGIGKRKRGFPGDRLSPGDLLRLRNMLNTLLPPDADDSD